MPYAQVHYPFAGTERFSLPADFIAEGLDQTRGWFYTLMVLSTALFDKPAFRNVVVNGLVLAEDGKKMSKRLKNYPDPLHVVRSYGADALRLYLIDSPVVRGDPLKFKEAGVLAVVRDLFLPWYNALRFLTQNAARLVAEAPADGAGVASVAAAVAGGRFTIDPTLAAASSNAMDRWISAAVQSLIKFVRAEMAAYRLYTVVPRLVRFIGQLTNWYVRLNRRRLKGSDGDAEAVTALNVLHEVLLDVARLMAPFTPFLAETQYQTLRAYFPEHVRSGAGAGAGAAAGGAGAGAASADALPRGATDVVGAADSVHYLPIPEFAAARIDEALETRVARMQAVVEAGRQARDARKVSLKQPVAEVVVVAADAVIGSDVAALGSYIKEELNCLSLRTTADEAAWCEFKLVPDMAILGRRLGAAFPKVSAALATWSQEQIKGFIASGTLTVTVAGAAPGAAEQAITLSAADVAVHRLVHPSLSGRYEASVSADGRILVAVCVELDDTLRSMGAAREICNRVQRLRKRLGLLATDDVEAYYSVAALSAGEFAAWQAASSKADADEGGAAAGGAGAAAGGDKAAKGDKAGKGDKAAKGGAGAGKGDKADKAAAPAAAAPADAAAAPAKGAKGGAKGAKAAASSAAAAAAAAGADDATTAAARAAAAAALHTAVVSNQPLISGALGLHLLPDIPSARPAHAGVIGSDTDIIGGAAITVTIARRALRFSPGDAPLAQAVRDAAAAAGVALEAEGAEGAVPQVAATAGPAGSVRFGSGRPVAEAVTVATAGPAVLPRSLSTVVAGAKAALVSADAATALAARLPAAGGVWRLSVDGVPLSLRLGTHFYGSAPAQLAANKEALVAAWKAEAGEVGEKLALAYAALA